MTYGALLGCKVHPPWRVEVASLQTKHPPKITKYRTNIWQLPQDILTITKQVPLPAEVLFPSEVQRKLG